MASHGGTAFNDAVIEIFLPCAGCNFLYLNPKFSNSKKYYLGFIAFF